MTEWVLSIDFGTTATAAAMSFGAGETVVEIDNAPRMPSMVCWKEGTDGTPGRLLLGDEAANEAIVAPHCLERCPKRRIGQQAMLLGSERVKVTDAIAAIFTHVIDEARRVQGGRTSAELRLTHPVRWGERRISKLREAAGIVGFDDPLLIPEPVGAAIYFAKEQLRPGDHVAVYDLGGGTFDTAVLRRIDRGFEPVGRAGGREDLGGEDFDDRLYRMLGRRLDPDLWQALISEDSDAAWQRANFDFKNDVRRAKEWLSKHSEATVRAPGPGDPDLQITASEFESLISDDVEGTVDELERTIEAAGCPVDELSAIYLAGGSSRIPLISRRIEARLGIVPSTFGDPKAAIALGATRALVADERVAVTKSQPENEPTVTDEPQQAAVAPKAAGRPRLWPPPSVGETRRLRLGIGAVIAVLVLAAVLAAGGTFSGSGGRGSQSASDNSALPATESCPQMQAVQRNGHTSCPFAINVFKAYWSNYKANQEQSTNVDAFSPRTHQSYVMSCRYRDGVVNCTGGIGARVAFPLAAVQTYTGHS